MGERRHRKLILSSEMLDRLLTLKPERHPGGGLHYFIMSIGVASDAPRDLHVIEIVERDHAKGTWMFICESASFDVVPEGASPPLMSLVFHSYEAEVGEG